MKIKFILFMISVLIGFESSAIEITLNNLPFEYRVFSMRGSNLIHSTYAGHFDNISFNIPSEYVILKSDGATDIEASLYNWRRSTPIADGNPRTKNGTGYFPFKDPNGNYRYIALEYILIRRPESVQVLSDEVLRPTARPKVRPQQLTEGLNVAIEVPPRPKARPQAESSAPSTSIRPLARGEKRMSEPAPFVADEVGDVDFNANSEGLVSGELVPSNLQEGRPSNLGHERPTLFNEEYPSRPVGISDVINSDDTDNASFSKKEWWNQMNLVEQAKYIEGMYEDLLNFRGVRDIYDPKILVCKAYRDHNFNLQSGESKHTVIASLTVTQGTVIDIFSRSGFRSKVEGFTHIQSGKEFYSKMASSTLAQMDLEIGILEQKREDNFMSQSSGNIYEILKAYLGSGVDLVNEVYAYDILNCVICLQDNGHSNSCLEKAEEK